MTLRLFKTLLEASQQQQLNPQSYLNLLHYISATVVTNIKIIFIHGKSKDTPNVRSGQVLWLGKCHGTTLCRPMLLRDRNINILSEAFLLWLHAI
jgi:hypothetical protein